MSTKYRLNCDCGHGVSVSARQAGEQLACPECGKLLEVPPLRAMRHLPVVDSEAAAKSAATWSRTQGSLFASGLVVTLLALATMANFSWRRSQLQTEPPRVEDLDYIRDVMKLTPTQSWEAWTKIFRGQVLGARNTPMYQVNRQISQRYLWFVIVSSLFFLFGLAAMISAFFVRS